MLNTRQYFLLIPYITFAIYQMTEHTCILYWVLFTWPRCLIYTKKICARTLLRRPLPLAPLFAPTSAAIASTNTTTDHHTHCLATVAVVFGFDEQQISVKWTSNSYLSESGRPPFYCPGPIFLQLSLLYIFLPHQKFNTSVHLSKSSGHWPRGKDFKAAGTTGLGASRWMRVPEMIC